MLDTKHGGVDIVQRAPGLPAFGDLAASAHESDIDGTPIFVCSLADLRAMKQAAGRPIDLADLDALPS